MSEIEEKQKLREREFIWDQIEEITYHINNAYSSIYSLSFISISYENKVCLIYLIIIII